MNKEKEKQIAIMDTTLRDGEQTPDIAYSAEEKLQLARFLLTEVGVDRIEIASTRASRGEYEAALLVTQWAKKENVIQRVEMLGFCDGKASVDWLLEAGGSVMNLLTKGSERHCRTQLNMTPEDHIKRIEETVSWAHKNKVIVNAYLEDWSNGVRDNFDYVARLIEAHHRFGVKKIYLADTLGIFSPDDITHYVGLMINTWPDLRFEYHGHDDYGLSTANCIAAINAGVEGIHTSVNGLGERAGNSSLAEVVAAIEDHTPYKTKVNESRLAAVSLLVETFSGKILAANAPILGSDVFTQTAGIHADGDAKGELYASLLAPQRFGRERRYALGKLSGKASLEHNLEKLGVSLSEDNRKQVLERIIELGDKKHTVVPEDLLMIIADVLKTPEEQLIRIESYNVVVSSNEIPQASVTVNFRGKSAHAMGTGDGGYNAFMTALKIAMQEHGFELPHLSDYRVRIPPSGRTDALVETFIRWDKEGETGFSTLGVDSDQIGAAVIATEKMLNIIAHEAGSLNVKSS